MEITSGDCLLDEAPSRDSLENLFPVNYDRCENFITKLMHPTILSGAKIEVSHQRSERVSSFIKTCREVTYQKPSDAEITHHLECHWQYDVVSWVTPNDHYKANVSARRGVSIN